MPPDSHSIFEEGAVFKSFKIVKEGVFQEEGKTMIKYINNCVIIFEARFLSSLLLATIAYYSQSTSRVT